MAGQEKQNELLSLNLIDLDAYNYLSCYVFDGIGATVDLTTSLEEKLKLFREELLSNQKFFDYASKPELLPYPILRRLQMACCCLAIEELTQTRQKLANPEISVEENFEFHSRISQCYEKLLHFLASDTLTIIEKDESAALEMFVEFKLLYYVSCLAAGTLIEGEYGQWTSNTARAKMEEMIALNAFEKSGFSDEAVEFITTTLEDKKMHLWTSIEAGQVEMNADNSFEKEQLLIKAIQNLLIQVNNEQLPVFHPNYHDTGSERIKQKSRDALGHAKYLRTKIGPWSFDNLGKKKLSPPPAAIVVQPKKRPTTTRPVSDDETRANKEQQRTRRLWTEEETKILEQGMSQYGNDWVTIRKAFAKELADRTPVNLKDRARSIRRIRERNNEDLGVFASASGS